MREYIKGRPNLYQYLRGKYLWLGIGGCCPYCYSSPPRDDCPVCKGSYDYGPKLLWFKKAAWLHKFKELRKNV